MATTLTSGELQRLRNMFEELDTDDSGDVSIAELRKVMEPRGGDPLTTHHSPLTTHHSPLTTHYVLRTTYYVILSPV